ncbi:serine/threonine-protein kinase Chk1-like [Sycon ciliatum]|uniref:serine/threonine-protein kinase Chk1-like n=1 Tax=Sycon ciliatum TaxID=27933 RepID=UPI0020A96121
MPLTPFVDGWDFAETLGEGAYGEVKLAINRKTKQPVAVKVIDGNKPHVAAAKSDIRKEAYILTLLSEVKRDFYLPIVRSYGHREDGNVQFIFLEFMSGGELFDRIEPGEGMPESRAQRYFCQLLHGVEYIHHRGITHRDLKPENLLLDANDNLKITDFGLATLFMNDGAERMMGRSCGTPPYIAPEVLRGRPYHARPSDLWSCGIVLVAMLSGEVPWDEPSTVCAEYLAWCDKKTTGPPWSRISIEPLGLLRKMLKPSADKRPKMSKLKEVKWVAQGPQWSSFMRAPSAAFPVSGSPPAKRKPVYAAAADSLVSASQPLPMSRDKDDPAEGEDQDDGSISNFFLSQPLYPDQMVCSQVMATQECSNPLQQLVRRLTRFWMSCNAEEAVERLSEALKKQHGPMFSQHGNDLTVSVQDRRRKGLIYKVRIIDSAESAEQRVLIDFRLSKGDGIEFKMFYQKIRDKCKQFIVSLPLP